MKHSKTHGLKTMNAILHALHMIVLFVLFQSRLCRRPGVMSLVVAGCAYRWKRAKRSRTASPKPAPFNHRAKIVFYISVCNKMNYDSMC